jgi:lipopolysaccharide transport system ATP-binding protein
MGNVAIRVESLSKQFRIGSPERYRSLRDTLTDTLAAPFRFLRNGRSHKARVETIWALKDVSFEVKHGEVIGILGRNGAGKSTLLKILSRIARPTKGHAEIHGRVGSLLEVGTGFHPELTGRENIFLNGAILGMKKAEILSKFDQIVDFAQVEKFIDTPVKHYSSGMYVRLAFAVAAHMEPEILVIDEVLAVGDAAFQRKCLGKIGAVAGEGRTVLFVSHNIGAMQKICRTCLWLQQGQLVSQGGSDLIIRQYIRGETTEFGRFDNSGRTTRSVRATVRNAWLEKDHFRVGHLIFGDQVDLIMEIEVFQPTLIGVELLLRQADGVPVAFAPSGLVQDNDLFAQPGLLTVKASLPPAFLAIGPYSIDLGLAESGVRSLDYIESGIKFHVDSAAFGSRNWSYRQNYGQGHTVWDVRFDFRPEMPVEPQRPGRGAALCVST